MKKLDNILQTELKNPSVKNQEWSLMSIDENAKWFKATADLNESRLFIAVTCDKNMVDVVDKYCHLTATIAAKINKDDGNIFKASIATLFDLNDAIRDAIRKELKVDEAA